MVSHDQGVLDNYDQGVLALPRHNQPVLVDGYHQEILHEDNLMAIIVGTNITTTITTIIGSTNVGLKKTNTIQK